jgi:hypothetical protein
VHSNTYDIDLFYSPPPLPPAAFATRIRAILDCRIRRKSMKLSYVTLLLLLIQFINVIGAFALCYVIYSCLKQRFAVRNRRSHELKIVFCEKVPETILTKYCLSIFKQPYTITFQRQLLVLTDQ